MNRIAYVALELGALTSTFIYREVEALRRLGVSVTTFSVHRPQDTVISDEARQAIEETTYLYAEGPTRLLAGAARYAKREPLRALEGATSALRDACLSESPSPRDRPKMLWHAVAGARLAELLKEQRIDHVHAHFANVATPIAMYAAQLAGIPYSFTCHANDIFERGVALREKVSRAKFVACISQHNVRFLTERGCDPEKLEVIRCGIDPEQFPYRERERSGPLHVVGVGRLVEKKGFAVLVAAMRELEHRGCAARCTIVGGGPLEETLRRDIRGMGLTGSVELTGSQPQEQVRKILDDADVFALPCVVAKSGDVDGIPVSLMEAMALGIPVTSTPISGIPELIHDGVNGLLAEPNDAHTLANALERLAREPATASTLAQAARRTIEKEFSLELNAKRLKSCFRGKHDAPLTD